MKLDATLLLLGLVSGVIAAPITPEDTTDLTNFDMQSALANSTLGYIKTDDDGNIVEHVIYEGPDIKLSRRSEAGTCAFGGSRTQYTYRYFPDAGKLVKGKNGDACIGWDTGVPGCGHNWNSVQEGSLKNSMDAQIKKDGAFKGSTVVGWTSTFFLATTAFADSDSGVFNQGLDAVFANDKGTGGARSFTYYYGRKVPSESGADMATAIHDNSC